MSCLISSPSRALVPAAFTGASRPIQQHYTQELDVLHLDAVYVG